MIQAGYFLFIIRRIMKCHSFVKALHAFLFFPGQIFYPYGKRRAANGCFCNISPCESCFEFALDLFSCQLKPFGFLDMLQGGCIRHIVGRHIALAFFILPQTIVRNIPDQGFLVCAQISRKDTWVRIAIFLRICAERQQRHQAYHFLFHARHLSAKASPLANGFYRPG